ncbi:VOC family protein [Listeria rustica]|uniref:VOC family protein n=1 Tax=Listeria rustica TaxID=2713503 RepID=A0A7W1T523_9LIST|nr:VOC family protein [Listeria rustica]MBA3925648.1 VOC family protein [Listeria rustica]
MIEGFEGINIAVSNPEAFVRFYKEQLGVPLVFEGHGNYIGAKLAFSRHDPGIIVWDRASDDVTTQGPTEFVFRSADLDKTYETLKFNGVDIQPPFLADWGGKELRCADPEGNSILILEGAY